MRSRRGFLALCLVSALFWTGGPVAAQTDVGDAEQRAQESKSAVDSAYQVVSGAVADRDRVEADLAAVLDRYSDAANQLGLASSKLESIGRSMAFADAQALDTRSRLANQSVAAYMESVVAATGVVFDADSLEDALVVEEVFGRAHQEALGQLDRLLVQQQELSSLRSRYQEEQTVVTELQSRLADESAQLAAMFEAANEEVAEAFVTASAADADYRAALSDVDRARAAEEAARRAAAAQAASTTTTAPPTTTSTSLPSTTTSTAPSTTTSSASPTPDPSTTTTSTTTTTTQPEEKPKLELGPAVEAWRPLVTQHFAPDLVEDALIIMRCESLGDPNALNPYSGAAGLYQFMPGTWAVASVQAGVGDRSVFDGEANIIAASWLAEYYRSRGLDPWRPWVCRSWL